MDGRKGGRGVQHDPRRGEVNDITHFPHGFFARHVPGKEEGFPAVVPTQVDTYRAGLIMAAVEEGSFIDQHTKSLEVQVTSYNAKLKLLALSTLTFAWTPSGGISFSSYAPQLVALFQPDALNIGALVGFGLLLPALWYLSGASVVLPPLVTAKWRRARSIRRVMRFRPSDRLPVRADWPVDSAAAVMDAILMFLFLAALTFKANALLSQRHVFAANSYDIYDSVTTALARLLLPSKQSPAAGPASESVEAGAEHRWQLPTNHTGMEQLGGTMHSVTSIATLTTCSNSLHSIGVVLAIARMLHSWSFQPNLSVITRSITTAAPRLVDLMILTSVVLVMLAGNAHLALGTLYADLNTPGKAIYFMLVAMVTDDMGLVHLVLPSRSGREVASLSQTAGYMGFATALVLLRYLLYLFIMVILIDSYYSAKQKAGQPSDVVNTTLRLFGFRGRRLRVVRKMLSSALTQLPAPRYRLKSVLSRASSACASVAAAPATRASSFIHFDDLHDHLDDIPLEVLLRLTQIGKGMRSSADGAGRRPSSARVRSAGSPQLQAVLQVIHDSQEHLELLQEMSSDVDNMILHIAELLRFPDHISRSDGSSSFRVRPLYEGGVQPDQPWWPSSPTGTRPAASAWQKVAKAVFSGVPSWLSRASYVALPSLSASAARVPQDAESRHSTASLRLDPVVGFTNATLPTVSQVGEQWGLAPKAPASKLEIPQRQVSATGSSVSLTSSTFPRLNYRRSAPGTAYACDDNSSLSGSGTSSRRSMVRHVFSGVHLPDRESLDSIGSPADQGGLIRPWTESSPVADQQSDHPLPAADDWADPRAEQWATAPPEPSLHRSTTEISLPERADAHSLPGMLHPVHLQSPAMRRHTAHVDPTFRAD